MSTSGAASAVTVKGSWTSGSKSAGGGVAAASSGVRPSWMYHSPDGDRSRTAWALPPGSAETPEASVAS